MAIATQSHDGYRGVIFKGRHDTLVTAYRRLDFERVCSRTPSANSPPMSSPQDVQSRWVGEMVAVGPGQTLAGRTINRRTDFGRG